MINYWKSAFMQNYSNFNGRARRSEFWYFQLMNFLIVIGLYILMGVAIATTQSAIVGGIFGGLVVIFFLASFIPSLAVMVRRLHDIGKSGWWYFIGLVPLIGGIWLLVLFCTDSQAGDNEYGANPKTSEVDLINTIN